MSATRTEATQELGFPAFATKNTTRVAGADPVADAAGAAEAVFPSGTAATRPRAVVLADARDWRTVLAAAALAAPPLRAPLLLSEGGDLPAASAAALGRLAPAGSAPAGGAQVIQVGGAPALARLKATEVKGSDPFRLARELDAFGAAARGRTSDDVIVVSADQPRFALPAAGYAAKTGDPILFATKDGIPAETRRALRTHQQPHIYVLGPSTVIGPKATAALRKLGTVKRVGGADPVANAIAFARYTDGRFGWGVADAGHGLVLAPVAADPATAGAVAILSASGSYGPLLLLSRADALDAPTRAYLAAIQPGYTTDPVRGVYNRAWIIGDEQAVSVALQSTIDRALEIVPVQAQGTP